MDKSEREQLIKVCAARLTEHIMKRENLDYEAAYEKLLATELYRVLQDPEMGLLYETLDYLCGAYNEESEAGAKAMYKYIAGWSSQRPWER